MTVLRTAILIILITNVQGETQGITPSLTLLSKVTQNKTNFTCVAGANVRGSAVTFITPLGSLYHNVPVSKYNSPQGSIYPPGEYGCDFAPGPSCLTEWSQDGAVMMSTTSEFHDLEPVIDERWEKFATYFSEFGNVHQHTFSQEVRSIGISVRTSGEANILLCENQGRNRCFWIILAENNKIELLSCVNINNKKPKRDGNCNSLVNAKAIPCNESNWTHYKLIMKRENGNTLFILRGLRTSENLLKHYITTILDIKLILLYIGNEKKGLWKIHYYNYLSLSTKIANNVFHQIGPAFQVDESCSFCVELYVAVCPTCTLQVGVTLTSNVEIIHGQDTMQRWRLVRLNATNLPQNTNFNLQILAIKNFNGFWLIDDVRRCHEDETRVITIKTPMNENDIVSCQALQQPIWWTSIKGGKIEQPSLSVCDNESYTGSNCNVSCTATLGTDCSKLMVCEPSLFRMKPDCTCASGYHGYKCQDICPQGYYGPGCTKQCGSCREHCLPTTGACSMCTPGDSSPKCTKDINTSIGTTDQQTQSDPALYALLLLLLIVPVIVWIAYRKCKKKENSVPDVAVSYTTVPTVPEITITGMSPQSKPKPNTRNSLLNKLPKEKDHNSPSNVPPNFKIANEIKDKKQIYSKIIKINQFSNYVKESLENGELEMEFKLLPEGGNKPWIVGTSEENNLKNRYKNLTAYDHTRVILDKLPGDPFSDFINASYIDGYKQNKAYIATQGPRKSTVDDFWRMIWQENVSCIVMITNLVEEGKIKCEKYWPDIDIPQEYGQIHVTLVETDTYADFEYRTFKMRKDKTIRQVEQYHFTSWPDHGVPLYPQSLVPFLNRLLTVSPEKAPIVIHCSAGIGRTGTIILADICLRMAAKENQIDILKYFHSMREQRVNMIAKYDQYVLVHMVLLESLLTPETSYPCIGLDQTVKEIIEKGEIKGLMQYLKDTAWHNQVMAVPDLDANIKNASKNRFPDIVPMGRRMYLSKYTYDDDSSDYINAVPVDGFRIKNQFIVTQNPLPNTVNDFWRLILEFNIKVIVSLNEIPNDKTSIKFWPSENEEMAPLPNLIIKCKSMISENGYEIYKIKLEDTRERGNNAIKSINIIHMKDWKYEQFTPASEEQLVTLLDAAQKFPREDEPVVVTCYDGARACGLYVALSFIIEKIKLEHICDVCLAVRTVRNNREQFVNDTNQFEFLYKAAVRYIATFELYSNFNIATKK